MKRCVLFLSALFCTTLLCAQDFQVSTISDGEKLSYSYIYQNGKTLGAADIDGVIAIPRNRLHIGDTISVSYVGLERAFVVYTEELATQPGCVVELAPNQVLTTVEVTAKFNVLHYFNKYVRKRSVPDWWCEFSGNADITFCPPQREQPIHTRFFYGMIPSRDGNTEAHTRTGVMDQKGINAINRFIIYTTIFHPLWRSADAPFLEEGADMNLGIIVRYQGEYDGKRHFLIARYAEQEMGNYQLLLIVNKETREIESAELELLYTQHMIRLSCKIDYTRQKLSFKNNMRVVAIYPSRIEAEVKFQNTDIVNQVTLSDIRLREYTQSEQIEIQKERDAHMAPIPLIKRPSLFTTD